MFVIVLENRSLISALVFLVFFSSFCFVPSLILIKYRLIILFSLFLEDCNGYSNSMKKKRSSREKKRDTYIEIEREGNTSNFNC